MRAALLALLAVSVAAPALACPPMKAYRPVDPVLVLQEMVDVGTNDQLPGLVTSAQWIARHRSRTADQRARALAVVAVARVRLGDMRGAARSMTRAMTIDADSARVIAQQSGNEVLLAAAQNRIAVATASSAAPAVPVASL